MASFTKKGNLNVHVSTVHNPKRYTCEKVEDLRSTNLSEWDGLDACGLTFSKKSDLIEHVRVKHMGMPPRPTWRKPKGGKEARALKRRLLRKITGAHRDTYQDEDSARGSRASKYRPESESQSLIKTEPVDTASFGMDPIPYSRPAAQEASRVATPADVEYEEDFDRLLATATSAMLDPYPGFPVDDDLEGLPNDHTQLRFSHGPDWWEDEAEMRQLIDDRIEDGFYT